MLRKKRRKSMYSRKNNFLLPTLGIFLVSIVAAFIGAVHWDKLPGKDKSISEDNSTLQAEISLPEPKSETPISEDDDVSEEEIPETEETEIEEIEEKPKERIVIVEECEKVSEDYFLDAAFVGDSLTQGLQLYDILDTNVVANKGINLQTVYKEDKIRVAEGYTSVLKELERIQPKKIYILLGANDIGWRTETAFKELYTELVVKLKEQHPDALIYLQSMFPVTKAYSDTDNGITNEKLSLYNETIIDIAKENNAYYLDIASILADESGALPDEISPDGMHLNAPYYKLWFEYLQCHVADEV